MRRRDRPQLLNETRRNTYLEREREREGLKEEDGAAGMLSLSEKRSKLPQRDEEACRRR